MTDKRRATDEERVKIWNTVFAYAYSAAAEIKGISPDWNPEGGKLSDEDSCKLRLLIFLILSVETRASHLILEKVNDNITPEQGESLLQMNFKQQWGLLPLLHQRPKEVKIDFKKPPHKIVADLLAIRNMLFHANLNGLRAYLDKKSQQDLIQYVVDFWESMENMNVLLGRDRKEAKPEVLAMVDKLR